MGRNGPQHRITNTGIFRPLEKLAKEQGWTVRRNSAGHIEWISPDQEQSMVVSSCTPGDNRVLDILKGDLRRKGMITDKQEWEALKKERRRHEQLTTSPAHLERDMVVAVLVEQGYGEHVSAYTDQQLSVLAEAFTAEYRGETISLFCYNHVPPKQFVEPYGAINHRRKCKEVLPQPEPEGEPEVERDMKRIPEREKMRCPVECGFWCWTTQVHLLASHLSDIHPDYTVEDELAGRLREAVPPEPTPIRRAKIKGGTATKYGCRLKDCDKQNFVSRANRNRHERDVHRLKWDEETQALVPSQLILSGGDEPDDAADDEGEQAGAGFAPVVADGRSGLLTSAERDEALRRDLEARGHMDDPVPPAPVAPAVSRTART
jgi:hypothetical protein